MSYYGPPPGGYSPVGDGRGRECQKDPRARDYPGAEFGHNNDRRRQQPQQRVEVPALLSSGEPKRQRRDEPANTFSSREAGSDVAEAVASAIAAAEQLDPHTAESLSAEPHQQQESVTSTTGPAQDQLQEVVSSSVTAQSGGDGTTRRQATSERERGSVAVTVHPPTVTSASMQQQQYTENSSDDDYAMVTANDDDDSNSGEGNGHAAVAVTSASIQQFNENDVDTFFYAPDGDPMAFCCAYCRCSPERRETYGGECSQADCGDYYHRHCCHKIRWAEVETTWLPPLLELQEGIQKTQLEYLTEDESYPEPRPTIITKSQVVKANANADTQVRNNDQIERPGDLLLLNEEYLEHQKDFMKVAKQREKDLRPAVVLDVFAGVGAALVVLKRLGIAMSTVIHVEHDKIATHVVRYNHDKEYNSDVANDGIQHVYVSSFDEIEGNIEQITKDYGPIDIIIGGPPCTDYSGINANAQGPQGAQGQFLPRFADFIMHVQAEQREHPVYHLIENVVFNDASRVKNYNLIQKKVGVVETKQDALYFSPCRRDRSFWLNVPLENSMHGYAEAVKIQPSSCLEEGWVHPGEDEIDCAKVLTFLASKGRINDDRMIKVKPLPNDKFEKGHFSALERERMMGFPEGYVQGAVEHLFGELFDKAYDVRFPNETRPDSLWKNRLDPKYFCFSGEPIRYEETYDETKKDPYVRILMSPPQVTANRDFFNAEDYSKRLIGNSFSIPVVEYLMTRLQEVFATRTYEGYGYDYRWEGEDET